MAESTAPSDAPIPPSAPTAAAGARGLLRPPVVRGTGLFSGATATLVIRPPAPGDPPGLHFLRVVAGRPDPIPALAERVVADGRHTVLTSPGAPASAGVQTTEHVLGALVGLGIWSAQLELDGPEVPIMDGSGEPFVRAVLAAGLIVRPGPRQPVFTITKPIVVESGPARVEATPLPAGSGPPRLEAEYHLDYGEAGPIPRQSARVCIPVDDPGDEFATGVAPARTFSLLAEALAARQAGLFAHVTPAEMLVIGDDGRPIENRWRMPDEPAHHKLLDLVGDLALVGGPIAGRVVARRSGHALNHALARAIRESVTGG